MESSTNATRTARRIETWLLNRISHGREKMAMAVGVNESQVTLEEIMGAENGDVTGCS
jgi:hypothetical protein